MHGGAEVHDQTLDLEISLEQGGHQVESHQIVLVGFLSLFLHATSRFGGLFNNLFLRRDLLLLLLQPLRVNDHHLFLTLGTLYPLHPEEVPHPEHHPQKRKAHDQKQLRPQKVHVVHQVVRRLHQHGLLHRHVPHHLLLPQRLLVLNRENFLLQQLRVLDNRRPQLTSLRQQLLLLLGDGVVLLGDQRVRNQVQLDVLLAVSLHVAQSVAEFLELQTQLLSFFLRTELRIHLDLRKFKLDPGGALGLGHAALAALASLAAHTAELRGVDAHGFEHFLELLHLGHCLLGVDLTFVVFHVAHTS